jgi:hypothetical protein
VRTAQPNILVNEAGEMLNSVQKRLNFVSAHEN